MSERQCEQTPLRSLRPTPKDPRPTLRTPAQLATCLVETGLPRSYQVHTHKRYLLVMETKPISSGGLAASATSNDMQRALDQRRTWLSGKGLAGRLGHPPLEQREPAGTPASWGEEHSPKGGPRHSRKPDTASGTLPTAPQVGRLEARAVTSSTWPPPLGLKGRPAEPRPQAAECQQGREALPGPRGLPRTSGEDSGTEPSPA